MGISQRHKLFVLEDNADVSLGTIGANGWNQRPTLRHLVLETSKHMTSGRAEW